MPRKIRGDFVIVEDDASNSESGLVFTLNWIDLNRALRNIKKLNSNELVNKVRLSPRGIDIFIKIHEEK